MIKKYFIIAAAIAITGCKSVPKQDAMPYKHIPDKVEYVVSLGGENWGHDLITVDTLPEAINYYETYKQSHGDMIITEVKYFKDWTYYNTSIQKNTVSVVD